MSILFKKPERKLDSFLVPIRSETNGKVRIRMVDDVVLQKVLQVSGQDAYVIQCLVKDNSILQALASYDEQALQHVVENCNIWFGTSLSEDKIRDMFMPSLNKHMEMRSLVSAVAEPRVVLNNNPLGSFYDLLPFLQSRNDLSSLRVIVEMDAQGIYIRPKKFGVRWMVRSLRVVDEDAMHKESTFDLCTRMDVNQQLGNDVDELAERVAMEIEELQAKVHSLEDFVRTTRRLLVELEGVGTAEGKEAEREWAEKAEALSRLVWSYQRGRSGVK